MWRRQRSGWTRSLATLAVVTTLPGISPAAGSQLPRIAEGAARGGKTLRAAAGKRQRLGGLFGVKRADWKAPVIPEPQGRAGQANFEEQNRQAAPIAQGVYLGRARGGGGGIAKDVARSDRDLVERGKDGARRLIDAAEVLSQRIPIDRQR